MGTATSASLKHGEGAWPSAALMWLFDGNRDVGSVFQGENNAGIQPCKTNHLSGGNRGKLGSKESQLGFITLLPSNKTHVTAPYFARGSAQGKGCPKMGFAFPGCEQTFGPACSCFPLQS